MTEFSPASTPYRRGLRVLLVDDNPDDRALVVRVLQKAFVDLQVEQVFSARDLDRALEVTPFDVVITDFQLCWTDGLAVLRAAKARDRHCPVVMFTGTGTEEVAVEAMQQGLDDYIVKSSEHFSRLPAAIMAAVRRTADRHALERANERFRVAFFDAPIGLAILDRRGTLVQVNSAWCDMFGYECAELQEMSLRALMHPDDLREPQQLGEQMPREGTDRVRIERRYVRKNGDVIWGDTLVSVVRDGDGDVEYHIAQVVDITERRTAADLQRKLDDRLRHTQKLESLGVMAGGIAHDFNNLLTSVLGNAECLRNELPEESRAQARAIAITQAARS